MIQAVTQKENEDGETVDGIVYEFAYDEWGNNKKVTIRGEGATISSTADYTEDGNFLEASTNALGKTTLYGYNIDTGMLEWVQYPEDTAATRTEFEYDDMYRRAKEECTTSTGSQLSAQYTFEDDYPGDRRTVPLSLDFDLKKWNGFGNILNNLAYLAHELLCVGNDFDWEVTYETVLWVSA